MAHAGWLLLAAAVAAGGAAAQTDAPPDPWQIFLQCCSTCVKADVRVGSECYDGYVHILETCGAECDYDEYCDLECIIVKGAGVGRECRELFGDCMKECEGQRTPTPVPAPVPPSREYLCQHDSDGSWLCLPVAMGTPGAFPTIRQCEQSPGTKCLPPTPTPRAPPPTPPPTKPPPTPKPAPVPAGGRWACGGEGKCIVADIGHSKDSTCEPTCRPPTPDMRFNCGGFGQCYQKKNGSHASLGACTSSCPKPTPEPTPRPTPKPTPKPQTMQTYQLVPPNFTGAANKNTGDVIGCIQFAIKSMKTCHEDDLNERCLEDSVLETATVTVDRNWGPYEECDLGKDGRYSCCDQNQHPPCKPTSDCRVGRQKKTYYNNSGYLYSFPQCGAGRHWTPTESPTRIWGSCLGNAWRKKAGGCPNCKGHHLNECVRNCTEQLGLKDLQLVWYHVTEDGGECPDAPLPTRTPSPAHEHHGVQQVMVVPTPEKEDDVGYDEDPGSVAAFE